MADAAKGGLSLTGLTKRFGGFVAVDDIDLLGESPAEMRGHVIQTSLGERQERSRGA